MWFKKVTSEVYIASGWKSSGGLNSSYLPSVLNSTKKSLIYNSILKYGHNNFSLSIL